MEANPEIQVQVQVFPYNDYIDKIMTMYLGGTPPDVFQTWAQYKEQWVEAGMLLDLTERWENSGINADEIYPFMIEAASHEGRIYGVPYDYNATVWIANLEVLAQAGFDLPDNSWTADDLRRIGQKVTDRERGRWGAINPIIADSLSWAYNWTGTDWLNEQRDRVVVDQPAFIDLVTWWYDNVYTHSVYAQHRPGAQRRSLGL